jgi:hypothetical protein
LAYQRHPGSFRIMLLILTGGGGWGAPRPAKTQGAVRASRARGPGRRLGPPFRRRQFCAIRSYLPTAAKHGLAFFDALVMLTSCRPWMPAIE